MPREELLWKHYSQLIVIAFVVLSITLPLASCEVKWGKLWILIASNEKNVEWFKSTPEYLPTYMVDQAKRPIFQTFRVTYTTVVSELWFNVWPLSDQEHFKLFFFSLLALQPNSTVSFYHHLIQINLGRKPCFSAGKKNLSTFSKTFWPKSKKVCSLLKHC